MVRPKVLILGAGFGGLYSYQRFIDSRKALDLDITVVNSTDSFTFTPMIGEYMTGEISLDDVQIPLAKIIKPKLANLIIDNVESIDLKNKTVKTSNSELSFDYLLIALGSTTNFYAVEGAKDYSHELKALKDAAAISNSLEDKIAKSIESSDEKPITAAVVGSGPKGVELAAKIREIGLSYIKAAGNNSNSMPTFNVQLIGSSPQILSRLPLKLRQKALITLEKQGIIVRSGLNVTRVRDNGLDFSNGESLEAQIIIWAAGIEPAMPNIRSAKISHESGQIMVDDKLRVLDYDNVFAIGDIASIDGDRKNFQNSAQVAVRQSKFAADNILITIEGGKLKRYNYTPIGIIVPLGRWKGVGRIAGINISGPIVWLSCKLVYATRFPIRRKRIKIAWHWLGGIIK